MKKRILLIRAHKTLAAGGPVPPLGLLYLASGIIRTFNGKYELKILHTGVKGLSIEGVRMEIEEFRPCLVGISAMTCEADLMAEIARMAKLIDKDSVVLAGGPHPTLAREDLLRDKNIDYGIIGEGEVTITELLEALENRSDLSKVDGIVYRAGHSIVSTKPRAYLENLDHFNISSSAWDLIDVREYARYPNWNGAGKEKFYIPIITSRGCPLNCSFCRSRNTFGNRFRARSPENVFSEIICLYKKYQIKEIHIFDDVFNYDAERAKKICALIIDSGIDFSLAFPNGLRADIINDELLTRLKEAGTYKINYGIETATPRLQQMIGKDLDIERVKKAVEETVRKGIITAGYFILGFPTETVDEMRRTVDFACNSNLDNAYFFKLTDFSGIQSYPDSPKSTAACPASAGRLSDFHFYSVERSSANVSSSELNALILEAQQRFYFSFRRILGGVLRSPNKIAYLKNLPGIFGLMLQAYLMRKLTKEDIRKKQSFAKEL